ncbi:BQ5605_C014g07484 [Microbotryum silenes-dioicae]|uniref:BQ5605_C014g07484 protein n=1 Tax=Microbotryum silenes-dioicae TaxID=796604 RepID=A0A2X0LXR8_9BASI|nr:BQ5605_C014g07484 [Microbotryum silenes-dioicae]
MSPAADCSSTTVHRCATITFQRLDGRILLEETIRGRPSEPFLDPNPKLPSSPWQAIKQRTLICQSAQQVEHSLNPFTVENYTTIHASVTLHSKPNRSLQRRLVYNNGGMVWEEKRRVSGGTPFPTISFLFFAGSHQEAVLFALLSATAKSRSECNARYSQIHILS